MNDKRVVITGLGLVTALGHNIDTFWENCLGGRTAIEIIPDFWKKFNSYKSQFWSPCPSPNYQAYGFNLATIKQTDPTSLNALISVRNALIDANLEVEVDGKRSERICHYEPSKVGVFAGCGIGGIASFIDSYTHHAFSSVANALVDGETLIDTSGSSRAISDLQGSISVGRRFNPFVVSMEMPNAVAANIGIHYQTRGACNSYQYACASSTIAVGDAFKAIASGELECCIAGGSELMQDPYGAIFRGFDEGRTLARAHDKPEQCNRPFDRDRSGFLFSEGGSGFMILESYESAKRRGARIYAEIKGFARTFEAHNIMMMNPDGVPIEDMTRSLLNQAKITPGDVQYVNAHGTGTLVNDAIESDVISRVFGSQVAVNSTKSILGHTLGASGALEAIVTALSISTGQLHPSLNIDNPIADLDFVRHARRVEISNAISQSFAFGGHNAALLFSRVG